MRSANNFALIGAAGYVAPRHMAAIKAVGGNLVAALDPHDSVGILDAYFPDCVFFTEFERFDRHCTKRGDIDYVTVLSPNYLHDSHCRFALRLGADAICEKPVVLQTRNLAELQKLEQDTGHRIWPILQMRLHPSALKAWQHVYWSKPDGRHKVEVTYTTPRGKWYDYSWKGDAAKSGGIGTNIGIHLFDMCHFLFGRLSAYTGIFSPNARTVKGTLHFSVADVEFYLSVDGDTRKRRFIIDGIEYDFSGGEFENLHTASYKKIVDGQGFCLCDCEESVKVCEIIREHQR